MSSPAGHQRGSRSSKPRGTKKRSTSLPFASLFATIASLSSSSSPSSPVSPALNPSTPVSRGSRSSPSNAHVIREDEQHMPRRRTLSKSSAPPSRGTDSKAIVKRQATPKQLVKASQPAPRTPGNAGKPDVFSFMSGEISTPPSPRPRAGHARGKEMVVSKPADRSAVVNGHIKAPTPRRPMVFAKSSSPLSSPSVSGISSSEEDDSSPDTPTPDNQKLLMASAKRSLERLNGQDAVGRSIRTDDYYKNVGRKPVQAMTPPPEAPMAPHLQVTPQKGSQGLGIDYQHYSNPSFNLSQNSPSMLPQSGIYSIPFQTPPLDSHTIPGLPSSHSAPTITQIQSGQSATSQEFADTLAAKSSIESFPRQYRVLTQSTIKRTETIIDNLEAELRTIDKTAQSWQREQLVMRLSNTLIMHHRLVDIWSKISQLNRLNIAKVEDKQRMEAVWKQLHQQYSHLSQINGLGVDKFISNVVNDLVYIGEESQVAGAGEGGRASLDSQDLRVIVILLGLIVVFLLIKDDMFQKFAIVASTVAGMYYFLFNGRLKPSIDLEQHFKGYRKEAR